MEGRRKSLSFHDLFCGIGPAAWRALHLAKEGREDGKLGAFPDKELEQELVVRGDRRAGNAQGRRNPRRNPCATSWSRAGAHMDEAFPNLLEQWTTVPWEISHLGLLQAPPTKGNLKKLGNERLHMLPPAPWNGAFPTTTIPLFSPNFTYFSL